MAEKQEENVWYIFHEDGANGPYSFDCMAEFLKTGELQASSLISAGDGNWLRAEETILWALRSQSRLAKYSVWLLAIVPILFLFVSALVLPGSETVPYIYFVLCCVFLFFDILQYRKSPYYSVYSAIIGLLFLPYYLYMRRDTAGKRCYMHLLVWTVLFVFYLSAQTIV
ncbi:MAG TPA: DUF4339 domain-containing protein [Clostridia bacterium]|nr:DUF4339 domain-containing protein [Clostridia bacterium]